MPHRLCDTSLTIAAALAGTVLALVPAHAADLDFPAGYGYGDAPPPQTKVEFGTGWYIRGDIGATRGPSDLAGQEPYDYGQLGGPYSNASSYTAGVLNGPGTAAPALIEGANRLGYVATLGGGYEFNRWFRADATFDFLQPTQSSYQGATHPCITSTYADQGGETEHIQSTNCTPTLTANLHQYAVLVNGYVDLGHWWIVTPYVGAGIGMSFGHASASSTYIQSNNAPYAGVQYNDALSGTSFTQNWDRRQSENYYNLAFALMGGVAFDVYPHTKLDIGYRYLHLGNVLGSDLYEHQVRAGLRYMIDN